MELSNASDPASANPTPQLFNKSMCAKYHHLFVAALHGYRNHLKLLSSLSRKIPIGDSKTKMTRRTLLMHFRWCGLHLVSCGYMHFPQHSRFTCWLCAMSIYTLSNRPIYHMSPALINLKMTKRRRGRRGRKQKNWRKEVIIWGTQELKSSGGYVFKLHLGQHWTFCLHMLWMKQVRRHQYRCWLRSLMRHPGALCGRMWSLR